MEIGVECNNHPDKSGVRLCDNCEMPFCSECLRRNFLGFYYCQNCYPALFSNVSAINYEIPHDVKGLERLQKQIESDVIKNSTNEDVEYHTYIFNAIVVGVILVIISLFIFALIIDLTSNILYFIAVDAFVYLLCGYQYGKYKPRFSGGLGIWLALPWFIFALGLVMLGNIGDVPIYTIIFLILGIFYLILASIGSFIGASKSLKKDRITTEPNNEIIFSDKLFSKIQNAKPSLIAFFSMILFLFLWHFLFVTELIKLSLFFIIFIYPLLGFFFGKTWPKYSWKWGILLVIPWFIITIYNLIYVRLFVDIFHIMMLYGLLYLILACIGAYIGTSKAE